MIKPKALKRGDTVGVITPSSAVDPARLDNGLKILEKVGLKYKMAPNVAPTKKPKLVGLPLDERVEDIMWSFTDDEVDGVFCADGGFGVAETLLELDYGAISKNPKVFMGFSDITGLNLALLAKCDLVTFNGPFVSIERGGEDEKALTLAARLLQYGRSWKGYPFHHNPYELKTISGGKASGVSIGGNLTTLQCLLGTPFMPDLSGCILFLEDINVDSYEYWRSLMQLKLAGVLSAAAGVVIGQMTDTPKTAKGDPDMKEVVEYMFGDGPPCISGYNFSHCATTACIPIGCSVTIDADKKAVSFGHPLS